jgi:hypothetical protein
VVAEVPPPFEPTSSARTDRAEVEALSVEVKALAASVAEVGALVEAGDAELVEVEMRMSDLETALDESRNKQLVAFELMELADITIANRLNGPKFIVVTDRFARTGGELSGATRCIVGKVRRLLTERSNVGAVEIAAALRLEAKRLLDPRQATGGRRRPR